MICIREHNQKWTLRLRKLMLAAQMQPKLTDSFYLMRNSQGEDVDHIIIITSRFAVVYVHLSANL